MRTKLFILGALLTAFSIGFICAEAVDGQVEGFKVVGCLVLIAFILMVRGDYNLALVKGGNDDDKT